MDTFSVLPVAKGTPVKVWDHGVPMEESVYQQARNLANVPGVDRVVIMPDAHFLYNLWHAELTCCTR